MKIKPEDLEVLRAAVAPLDTPTRRKMYENGRAHFKGRNLDMRYRWDLLYASKLKIGDGVGVKGDLNLYAYLNDDHIDTALRAIVPALNA